MPDLTLGAALLAGLVSFLSPCVLPVVPAYLGQLGALSVAGERQVLRAEAKVGAAAPLPALVATATTPIRTTTTGDASMAVLPSTSGRLIAPPARLEMGRRGHALLHALVFVAGFTTVFTTLGLTATYAGGHLGADLPFLRQLGGVVLVVLGLNVMGVLRLRPLARSWRPFDTFGARSSGPLASRTPLGALGLGAIFALGWTPCIGPTLGAIFGLSALGPSPQLGFLFMAYSIGLGLPFLGLALALDRAPALIRPLLRHGRLVELVGGAFVVLVGLAILFDWLGFFARLFLPLTPRV